MARGRPIREDLDYFSHDTTMRRDRKLALAIAESPHSAKLFGVYNGLLEDIYHHKYYMKFTEEDKILFISSFSDITPEIFDEIFEVLLRRELFDKELFDSAEILTSASIQRRWLIGCARRTRVRMDPTHVLIDLEEFMEEELAWSNLTIDVVENSPKKNNTTKKKVNGEKKVETKTEIVDNVVENYTIHDKEKWDEGASQPIDYDSFLDYWNTINGGQARMTPPKKVDIRRSLRVYTGAELGNALFIRAKDPNMANSKYRTRWSTFFGQKKLENVDKWVDAAANFKAEQREMDSKEEFLESGWYYQKKAKEIADKNGMPLEDAVFWETKKVEDTLLYYPKFNE